MTTSTTKRKTRITISTEEQWEAITSPVRFEICTFLEGAGPCSIAELAELMDVPADSLYHHIRILLKAAIVVEAGFRKKGRQIETIYDVAADEISFDLESDHHVERINKLNAAVLRQCSRNLKSALESGQARFRGQHRNLYARLETAWLTRDELAEVRQHVEAISSIFENGRKKNRGQLMMACLCLGPVVRSRRKPSK